MPPPRRPRLFTAFLLLINGALLVAAAASPRAGAPGAGDGEDLEVPSRAPEAASDGLSTGASSTAGPAGGLVDPGDAALRPFYRALHVVAGGGQHLVSIAHFGDSHVASDVFAGRMRKGLQARFGDGGPGFVLAGRPWRSYYHSRVKTGVDRPWRAERTYGRYSRRRPSPRDDLQGLAGISVHAPGPRQAWWELRGRGELRDADLYYLAQPGGGVLELWAGEGDALRRVRRLSTAAREGPRAGFMRVALPEGTRRLELHTSGGEVRLFGADLGSGRPGVRYHTFGINGARAESVLAWNEALMAEQLTRLAPRLFIVAYGTNEVDNRSLTREAFARSFGKLLSRMRRALPEAACLVLGPPDRARWVRRKGFEVPDTLEMVVSEEQRLALAQGCAFWDQRRVMGGAGAIESWMAADPPLARTDRVHLHVAGYERLADALLAELLEGLERNRK